MEVVFFVILIAFRLATLKLGVPPLAVDLPPDSVLCPEKMISKSSCHLLRMLGKACSMKLSRDDFPAHAVVLAAVAALTASEDALAAAARAKATEDAASAAREIAAADGKIPARTVPGTAAVGAHVPHTHTHIRALACVYAATCAHNCFRECTHMRTQLLGRTDVCLQDPCGGLECAIQAHMQA